VLRLPSYEPPKDYKLLVKELFFTSYMGTSNSSKETRARAEELAKSIGANYYYSNIDAMVTGV